MLEELPDHLTCIQVGSVRTEITEKLIEQMGIVNFIFSLDEFSPLNSSFSDTTASFLGEDVGSFPTAVFNLRIIALQLHEVDNTRFHPSLSIFTWADSLVCILLVIVASRKNYRADIINMSSGKLMYR